MVIRKKGSDGSVEETLAIAGSKKTKRRKIVNTQRDCFYASVSKMTARGPDSHKGTIPHKGMVLK